MKEIGTKSSSKSLNCVDIGKTLEKSLIYVQGIFPDQPILEKFL